ncbi:MAG: class I SAM-dependent methyltransferase [Chloroflexi bacterium]|nr:class I SAM-dependent methyltransferase [Chloroflexota bacterium]
MRWFFEFTYRLGKPPWDWGITPPEVVSEVEGGRVRSGRALDLGCGTGTNAIYLAQHGFQVVGVDFSSKAIDIARRKARTAGVAMDLYVNDVTRLDFLREPFDFVLDIGCFHGLDRPGRARYAENVARLTQPHGLFMLYAFGPTRVRFQSAGATEDEVKRLFGEHFALSRVEHGMNRGEIASAWYWLERE